MDVFYIAYYHDNELIINAFDNKTELNKFVKELKLDNIEYNVIKLQNNESLKGFIDFISDNKLGDAYHEMMQLQKGW